MAKKIPELPDETLAERDDTLVIISNNISKQIRVDNLVSKSLPILGTSNLMPTMVDFQTPVGANWEFTGVGFQILPESGFSYIVGRTNELISLSCFFLIQTNESYAGACLNYKKVADPDWTRVIPSAYTDSSEWHSATLVNTFNLEANTEYEFAISAECGGTTTGATISRSSVDHAPRWTLVAFNA